MMMTMMANKTPAEANDFWNGLSVFILGACNVAQRIKLSHSRRKQRAAETWKPRIFHAVPKL